MRCYFQIQRNLKALPRGVFKNEEIEYEYIDINEKGELALL